jgi:hypothetical protein
LVRCDSRARLGRAVDSRLCIALCIIMFEPPKYSVLRAKAVLVALV